MRMMKRMTAAILSGAIMLSAASSGIWLRAGAEAASPAEDVFQRLPGGASSYTGHMDEAIRFVQEHQLGDVGLFDKFVEWFRTDADADGGFRQEYWGKMVRGGSMIYAYTRDETLYQTMETTVRDMLTTQDEEGRITTYPKEKELMGWDLWGRKYTLIGLHAFYDICRNEALKAQVLKAMRAHADYIVSKVGPESEGKRPVLAMNDDWGGMASSSILAAMVRLYRLTGEESYLKLCQHIVDSGFSTKGNLIELAMKGELSPYQYPIVKSYEMMACFEGLLEYYRMTGEEQWLTAVKNFAYSLMETDITVTGHTGFEWEFFCNAAVEQSNPDYTDVGMDTCSAVVWLNLCDQMLRLTGDPAFADAMEKTIYNAVLGALNSEQSANNGGVMFDSYNPIMAQKRGRGLSGYTEICGCCVAIGSTGLALIHTSGVMASKDGLAVNLYQPGKVGTVTPSGKKLDLLMETTYPQGDTIKLTISPAEKERFTLRLRIPAWSTDTGLTINNQPVEATPGDYAALDRQWAPGDTVTLKLDLRTRLLTGSTDSANTNSRYHVALERGPIVLTRDARLDGKVDQTVEFVSQDGYVETTLSEQASFPAWVECEAPLKDGGTLHLVDYSSAGKRWDNASMLSVWMPTKAYWEVDYTQPVVAWECNTKRLTAIGSDGNLSLSVKNDGVNPARYAWRLEEAGEGSGLYRIRMTRSGKYLMLATENAGGNGARIIEAERTNSRMQLWRFESIAQNRFHIVSAYNSRLLSRAGWEENAVLQMWDNIESELQVWSLENVELETEDVGHSPQTNEAFVADLPWERCEVLDYGTSQMLFIKESVKGDGSPISIAGEVYSNGLSLSPGQNTPASIELDIAGRGFTTFTSVVGKDDNAGNYSKVHFTVVADGKVVAESGELDWKESETLTADITGCETLVLSVDCASDGFGWDYAAWGDPKLTGPEGGVQPDERVYLSDMAWQSYHGYGSWLYWDQADYQGDIGLAPITMQMTGSEVRIGFNKGVTMHPGTDSPGELAYTLGGRFKTFHAVAGKTANIGGDGSQYVVFNVLVDGKVKATSGRISAGVQHVFDVDVSGAQTLILQVTDGEDGYAYDSSSWGNAYLTKDELSFARASLENAVSSAKKLQFFTYKPQGWTAFSQFLGKAQALLQKGGTKTEFDEARTALLEARRMLVAYEDTYEQIFVVQAESGNFTETETRTADGVMIAENSPNAYLPDNLWTQNVPAGKYRITIHTRLKVECGDSVPLINLDFWEGENPSRVNPAWSHTVYRSEFSALDEWTELSYICSVPVDCAKLRLQFFHLGGSYELDWYSLRKITEPDIKALTEFIEQYGHLKAADYTIESWQTFADQMEKAQIVIQQPDIKAQAVKELVQAIENAYDKLVKVTQAVDKSGLEELIVSYAKLKESDYTASSWKTYADKLAEAKALIANDAATQTQVDDMVTALTAAKEGLKPAEPVPPEVNKDALEALIASYADLQETDYTAASWKVYADKLAEAKALAANDDATQTQVDDMVTALTAAKEGLKPTEPAPPEVNKDALEALIASYAGLVETGYTAASWKAYADKLAEAKALAANDDATQTQVDDMVTALTAAKNGLEKKAENPEPVPPQKAGWRQEGNKWYFTESSGKTVTGWKKLGKWYYFGSDGAMKTGWFEANGKWYFAESSGAMVTGWKKLGKWYYFGSDGAMKTGWFEANGKWYFAESSGAMVTGWKKLGKWYYFGGDGKLVSSTTRRINGKAYRFNANGVCLNP